jgi:hypothetical protein
MQAQPPVPGLSPAALGRPPCAPPEVVQCGLQLLGGQLLSAHLQDKGAGGGVGGGDLQGPHPTSRVRMSWFTYA